MNIIEASYEILHESDLVKKVEKVARLCYKSEDKITDGSDIKMFKMLLDRNHLAMLEHSVLTVEVDKDTFVDLVDFIMDYHTDLYQSDMNNTNVIHNNYLKWSEIETEDRMQDTFILTGNIRAWYETLTYLMNTCGFLPYAICDVLKHETKGIIDLNERYDNVDEGHGYATVVTDYSTLCPQARMLHEHLTVLFNVDRGVTHELVRMRECSFAQESTRYCNYSNGKFGSEITVIHPLFFEKGTTGFEKWRLACEKCEEMYMALIDGGAAPQQARDVLPQSVKASIYVTANLSEWHHIFNLRACRATGPAHPQMEEVMQPLLEELQASDLSFAFKDLVIPEET